MWSLSTALSGAAITLAGAAVGATVLAGGRPATLERPVDRAASLSEAAGRHRLHVGVSIRADPLRDDAGYRRLVEHHFDTVTIENALKWSEVHPRPGVYRLERAAEMIEAAEAAGQRVRGHTLVWHEQLPDWLRDARMTRDQAIALLRDHITTVVGAFRGRLVHWDVVNEPLAGDGSGGLRDTVWRRSIGDDYLDVAFRAAHAADPDALLFINDYDPAGDGAAVGALVDLAIELRSRGVPVHGVGLQHHLAGRLDVAPLAAQLRRATAAGLDVAFTEVDDRLPVDAGPAERLLQARRVASLLQVCLDAPSCGTVVFWGLDERHSWIPEAFPGSVAGTLFDEELRPTPVFHVVADLLERHPQPLEAAS